MSTYNNQAVMFISHGAPDALFTAPASVACWREMRQRLEAPQAILVISAHWEANMATVSFSPKPDTIHDFSGFSPALNQIQYPVFGALDTAKQVLDLLASAKIQAGFHPNRGLDHGAWVPLSILFPDANIPVVQLSLVQGGSPGAHYAIGQVLAPLRKAGVCIVASGAVTHNFTWLRAQAESGFAVLPQAQYFADWVSKKINTQDISALLAYRSLPDGSEAHPTPEHFAPLFVALGAAGNDQALAYCPYFTYGSLAMNSYLWQGNTHHH